MMSKICLVYLVVAISKLSLADDVIVEISNGQIRGREAVTFNGKQFFAFEKIPYAAPPTGNLRFKAPVSPPSWEGILNTTENNVICFQTSFDSDQESEDCLYLNVFTPELRNGDGSIHPVMLFIYGGGFVDGNCLYSSCGPEFLIDYDVVVVTINYRVGPFGFLSTEDTVIPGNNGLRDQQMAIKWTHDNIMMFGGDRNRITIFGQSAGSASVGYQLLHTKSEGLFRGAIMESGSPLSPWAFQRRSREYAFRTAGFINETFNDSDDSQQLLDFLLSVTDRELDAASNQLRSTVTLEDRELSQGFFYAPVVEPEHEEAFITENMYVSLKNGNFLKVPILIGINSEEQIDNAGDLNGFKSVMAVFDENPSWLVPDDMKIQTPSLREEMGKAIRQVYTTGLLQDDLAAGIRYFSDTAFTRSVIKHAELQSKFTPVYFYQFSYDGTIGNVSVTLDGAESVNHSEELKYFFAQYYGGYDNRDMSVFPEADVITHLRLLQIWTDFVKTLHPTPWPTDIMQNINWPELTSEGADSFAYVDIRDNLEITQHPKEETYRGWVKLYNSLGYDDFDTY